MQFSEEKQELFKAFAKYNEQIVQPTLDATNPFFKSGYLTLGGVDKTVREAFKGTGLDYKQIPINGENGGIGCYTIVTHSSGQYMITDQFFVKPTKNDAQGQGSALTYAKRYQLQSVFGVVGEKDDDGNSAVGKYQNNQQQNQQNYQQQNQQRSAHDEYQSNLNEVISRIQGIANAKGVQAKDIEKWIMGKVSDETGKDEVEISPGNIGYVIGMVKGLEGEIRNGK